MLEGFVAEVAAMTADNQAKKRLGEVVKRMESCFDNLNDFYDADVLFHETIARATNNKVLYRIVIAITNGLREERKRIIKTLPKTREHTLNTAREILAAINERDKDRARAAMEEHLQDVRDAMVHPEKSDEVPRY
jgi:GntR family transcriptional repressor for pyruvate dehydrogenase complex